MELVVVSWFRSLLGICFPKEVELLVRTVQLSESPKPELFYKNIEGKSTVFST